MKDWERQPKQYNDDSTDKQTVEDNRDKPIHTQDKASQHNEMNKTGNQNGKHGTWKGKMQMHKWMSVQMRSRNDTNEWNDMQWQERYEKITDYWSDTERWNDTKWRNATDKRWNDTNKSRGKDTEERRNATKYETGWDQRMLMLMLMLTIEIEMRLRLDIDQYNKINTIFSIEWFAEIQL